jgi:hypothetical protein
MPLHLSKFAVGCDSLATLERRQQPWTIVREDGRTAYRHRTRFLPKRWEEVVDGGSLYWIIKGQMLVRQSVFAFEPVGAGDDAHVLIHLDPQLVPTLPTPKRMHQGWRYLTADDAPADAGAVGAVLANMPPTLIKELRALALL